MKKPTLDQIQEAIEAIPEKFQRMQVIMPCRNPSWIMKVVYGDHLVTPAGRRLPSGHILTKGQCIMGWVSMFAVLLVALVMATVAVLGIIDSFQGIPHD